MRVLWLECSLCLGRFFSESLIEQLSWESCIHGYTGYHVTLGLLTLQKRQLRMAEAVPKKPESSMFLCLLCTSVQRNPRRKAQKSLSFSDSFPRSALRDGRQCLRKRSSNLMKWQRQVMKSSNKCHDQERGYAPAQAGKKDPTAPRRPLSRFSLFCAEYCLSQDQSTNAGISIGDVATKSG